MDPDKLTERAVALGLITQNQTQTMDEKAKYRLIFLPGFSTSRKVNDLSGRGVGMDVVKSNIESIGGKVTIESQPGLGSRFLIEVPLTLAIIPSQIVQTEHQRLPSPRQIWWNWSGYRLAGFLKKSNISAVPRSSGYGKTSCLWSGWRIFWPCHAPMTVLLPVWWKQTGGIRLQIGGLPPPCRIPLKTGSAETCVEQTGAFTQPVP